AVDIGDVERDLARARGCRREPPALDRRQEPPHDIHLRYYGAAADQYAVDRLQIVEVDRGVDWFFKQSRAAARDQKQNERLFRVVYAQNVQGLRGRFQTTGVGHWMSTDDYRQ